MRSSGFAARTGVLADNFHYCRTRSGVRGKGTSTSPTFWTIVWSALRTSTPRRKGRQCFFLIPTMYANGRVDRPIRTPPHGIMTISDLGEVGC